MSFIKKKNFLSLLVQCTKRRFTLKNNEIAFQMSTSNVRFGKGATREIGLDFVEMNMKHILVVTDSHLQNLSPVKNVLKSLDDVNLKYTVLSDQVKVEPTDVSIQQAIETAKKIKFDAIAAVGGG